MPELPEVETVCRGLAKSLVGHVIKNMTHGKKRLRAPFPYNLAEIENCKITGISRRAKYILIHLDDGMTLIVHLGMSGRFVINPEKRDRHDHLTLIMNSGDRLVLNDPRRFGLVALAETKSLAQHKLFRHLGPEPFDKAFNPNDLARKLKGKKISVKLAVMDQRVVVGVGNIYASEALFGARIDPRRRAGTLKTPEIKKLVRAIRKTLAEAIAAGGSSLRNYVQSDGALGYFQHRWAVYGKAGQKCKGCACDIRKTGGIRRIMQGGRATFYCPQKQK